MSLQSLCPTHLKPPDLQIGILWSYMLFRNTVRFKNVQSAGNFLHQAVHDDGYNY